MRLPVRSGLPLIAPRESDRRIGERHNSFTAAGEAECFARRRLHGHALDRNARNLRDAPAHRVAVRTYPRGLAHDGRVKVRDAPAARLHAFDGEGKKAIGRSAAPLRITRREVHADVAFAQSAKDRINKGMKDNVGVGMAGHTAALCDADATETDMIAVGELVYVKAKASADVGERGGIGSLRAGKILWGAELHVAAFASKRRDLEAGPFRERRVVSEIL